MRRVLQISTLLMAFLFFGREAALAQRNDGVFRNEAFSQNYNPADTLGRDTTDVLFSFGQYFRGLRHKEELDPAKLFAGATFMPGSQQIYNRQYWKLPLVYGSIGAGVGLGIYYNHRYKETGNIADKHRRTLCWAGAGLAYWCMLMDGNANYAISDDDIPGSAGKATVYSILFPGLGQIYNGEYWKIPLYYTGLLWTGSYIYRWNMNYRRYRRIYNEITMEDSQYTGKIQASTALYYRNVSRRYRDYFIVGFAVMYLLQVIDANVFAFMRNFEVDDNISLKVGPAVLPPGNLYAAGSSSFNAPTVGLKFGLTF